MKRKRDCSILTRMLKELGSLALIMLATILCGVCGYLAASSIAVFASIAAVSFLNQSIIISFSTATSIIIASAVLRGIFRYAEQISGHYIAFKILAIIRDKVFTSLRKLAPAKLDTKEKGNLVSIITSDIELMEVFYAHTIAPVIIAFITSVIYTIALNSIHIAFGVLAVSIYIIIGFVLPMLLKKLLAKEGTDFRKNLGKGNAYFFDSLRGLKETLSFDNGTARKKVIEDNSKKLGDNAKKLKKYEGLGYAITDFIIIAAIFGCLAIGYSLYSKGLIDISSMIVATVLLASSFGPVVALSALSTTLAGTLASARRVFEILDEKPIVDEISGTNTIKNNDIVYENVGFSYPCHDRQILKCVNTKIKRKQSIAITGSSGSGKSTILKLLMRFYDVDSGKVCIGDDDTRSIPTNSLRNSQVFVSQETVLFNDTLENNIRMENENASMQEVIAAAKKASIHGFIKRLPEGYKTKAGELGDRLSSGEKQRIALARAFLKNSDILLLDEPTSNLDVLNEAQILKSIKNHCKDKTVILVSHRQSTTAVCDRILKLEDGDLEQIDINR